MANSIYNFVMAINISTHESVKSYSYLNVFNEKNINTFDILTFKQIRTDENKLCQIKKTFTGGSKCTPKKVNECGKKICVRLVKIIHDRMVEGYISVALHQDNFCPVWSFFTKHFGRKETPKCK